MHYYFIALTTIIRKDCDFLTYASEEKVPIGSVVSVPVGKKTSLGVVYKTTKKPTYETREIISIVDTVTIPPELLKTAQWMSTYYATPLAHTIKLLIPAGVTTKRRSGTINRSASKTLPAPPPLTTQQKQAFTHINESTTTTHLLHGVTGSGKTHVYIEKILNCLKNNLSAIVLVPEIALSSQLMHALKKHVSDIILTHSQQTESERHKTWQYVGTKKTPLVIVGPRSALFLPVQNIGAIIIDEFHEPSYKQEKAPRYSAIEVASYLAKQHGGTAILGSATPAIAHYYTAENKKESLTKLIEPARKKYKKPTVTLVDTTKRTHFATHPIFSQQLLTAMEHALENNEQILLFHNRRGTATLSLCEACGWQAACPRCYIPLTLHADTHTLSCHTCSYKHRAPTSCPSCASPNIVFKGIGTKRIQDEIQRLYPNKKCVRFDADTDVKNSFESQYDAIADGTIDIIIGTQIIAKGLDLPHLQTVGVVQADAGLSLPDYSSSERTFQLLSQVVGRVGRDERATQVVIQSYQPNHPAVKYGTQQDYASFYKHEIARRKHGVFPPFVHLLKLVCIYKTEAVAIKNAKKHAEVLKKHAHKDVVVHGPTPAFYERIGDTYRWQLVVKSPNRDNLIKLLQYTPPTHWQYELDPLTLL